MKRLLLLALSVLFAFNVYAQDEPAYSWDGFRLLTFCGQTRLLVEGLHQDAAQIGLTKNSIETLVRSRLRAARIYTENLAGQYLYVNVNVVGSAYGIRLSFNKPVKDSFTQRVSTAETWDSSSTGTHGRDAGFILQSISQHIDKFIDDYLRVNADYCE